MPLSKITWILFIFVGILVCCVVMQMVGVNHSLWDPFHLETDLLDSSIVSAVAIVAVCSYIYLYYTVILGRPPDPLTHQRILAVSLDRPPAS